MINRIRDLEPQKVLLIIGLIYGILFLVIIPPFQAPDEDNHFYKAYQFSDGKLFQEKSGNAVGIYVPKSLVVTTNDFSRIRFNPNEKVKIDRIAYFLSKPLNQENKIFLSYSNNYPPPPYLPSAFIMILPKLFGLSPLVLMYLGRIINLYIFLFLAYLAIKITPVHKWVFLMLALMPMTLFISASVSPDSYTIGVSFLIIAFFLWLSLDPNKEKIYKKDLGLVLLLSILITLAKPLYFFSVLLFLMIPSNKFENKKQKWFIFALLITTVILIFYLWQFLVAGTSNVSNSSVLTGSAVQSATGTAISATNRIVYILNPVHFVTLWFKTIKFYGNFILSCFVGNFGWEDTPLPIIYVYLYSALLILVSLLEKEKIIISLKQKLVIATPFILFFVSISTYFFVFYSPKSYAIGGIVGRYFIPISPLLFLLFYNKYKIKLLGNEISFEKSKNLNVALILFIVISLSISLFVMIKRFYLV